MAEPDATAGAVIRVLLVDDHPLLREGLAAILEAEPNIAVVAQASNGAEAIACFEIHRPDVTVMDVQMPGIDGVAATASICSAWPGARVLILTTYQGDVQALRALKAGASGYLLKSAARMGLMDAIRSVHAGRRYIPPEIAAALAAHVADETLSTRETAVLEQLAAGGSNKAIAARLFISEDTVKSHVKSILSKLSASDRTQAVVIAVRRGIIDV